MKLELHGEMFELLPDRAFFWERESMLGLSDIHLGKADSLQQVGIPLPSQAHGHDLDRITALIARLGAQRVFILGDFVHDRTSWTRSLEDQLRQFFAAHGHVQFTLILGNHEKGSDRALARWPLRLIEGDVTVGNFCLSHGHHEGKKKLFQISGHVHPVVKLRLGSTKLRLPCFVQTEHSLLIPSFGELTGGYEIKPRKNQRIFAVAGEKILEVL